MTPGSRGGSHLLRTRLAWRRTVLAAGVVALLAGRLALRQPPTTQAALAGAAGLGWLLVLVAASRRVRALDRPDDPVVRRAARLVAVATVGYALAGALVVVLTSG